MTIAEKLTAIANKQIEVYEAGKASGGDKYYDTFWDSYQNYGNRSDHSHAFSGEGWNNETFKPKYDIKVDAKQGAYMLFRLSQIEGDLVEILKNLGVSIVYYNNSSCNYMFQSSLFSRVGEIVGKDKTYDSTFKNCNNLETIDGITSETGYFKKFTSTFDGCIALKNITFNGDIQCDIDIHWSTLLSADSLKNIIDSLSPDTSGFTITLPTTAEATYDAKHGEGAWATLITPITNWTIAYA